MLDDAADLRVGVKHSDRSTKRDVLRKCRLPKPETQDVPVSSLGRVDPLQRKRENLFERGVNGQARVVRNVNVRDVEPSRDVDEKPDAINPDAHEPPFVMERRPERLARRFDDRLARDARAVHRFGVTRRTRSVVGMKRKPPNFARFVNLFLQSVAVLLHPALSVKTSPAATANGIGSCSVISREL